MELEGRVALVTGGARRLGRALSMGLARAGADVIVNYLRSADEAAGTVAAIQQLGRSAVAVRADVSQPDDTTRLVGQAQDRFGRLDVLVNSASLFESARFEEIDERAWDRVMAVNLKGPFLLSRAAANLLAEDGGGVIINITDLSGLRPWPAFAHHSVSKAGLVHLTRVLARILAPAVRVNCIAPGTVLPPAEYTPEQVQRSRDRTVLKRIGSPDDVVRAMLFLVSSDFATGELVVVDGGRMLL